MQITITFQKSNKSMDFQLNAEMMLKDALLIISQNSDLMIEPRCKYVYSNRNQKKIPTTYTFLEAEIYSGDILTMEENKNGN